MQFGLACSAQADNGAFGPETGRSSVMLPDDASDGIVGYDVRPCGVIGDWFSAFHRAGWRQPGYGYHHGGRRYIGRRMLIT